MDLGAYSVATISFKIKCAVRPSPKMGGKFRGGFFKYSMLLVKICSSLASAKAPAPVSIISFHSVSARSITQGFR